jgi:hypothetical protein
MEQAALDVDPEEPPGGCIPARPFTEQRVAANRLLNVA